MRAPAQAIGILLLLFCSLPTPLQAEPVAAASNAKATADVNTAADANTKASELRFMNRSIITFRATLVGATPAVRQRRAAARLDSLSDDELTQPLDILRAEIEDEPIALVRLGDRLLFSVAHGDQDPADERSFAAFLDGVHTQVGAALAERVDGVYWPHVLRGLGFSLVATVVLGALIKVIFMLRLRLENKLQQLIKQRLSKSAASRLNWGTSLYQSIARTLLVLISLVALALTYLWLTFVLKQFVFTQPVGDQLSGFLLSLLVEMGGGMLSAVPNLITLAVIFLLTKTASRLVQNLFDSAARGALNLPGLHPDTIGATRRIVAVVVWMLGFTFAYPYIPGSESNVFKGFSVLAGLMLTMGSSGIMNQLMSGLTLVYSRALRKGDLVQIGDVTGVVEDVSALSVKLLRVNEEITVPNAVVVGNTVRNYSKKIHSNSAVLNTIVTIGYDAPWRQVHEMLLAAAAGTEDIAIAPAPLVLQRALSDFYVEYELRVAITDIRKYVETMSQLHANIQDKFNEQGVQIMSPHFMVQPAETVVIPKADWSGIAAKKNGPAATDL